MLVKISHHATAACSYLKALNRVKNRFFPFAVDDGVVTVGESIKFLYQTATEKTALKVTLQPTNSPTLSFAK